MQSSILVGWSASADFNILFLQSYTPKTPFYDETVNALKQGFDSENISVNINVEYLDANYWDFYSEKEIMKRFCKQADETKIDLIVTNNDEAFYTLMNCGDSLAYKTPIVFMNIKYLSFDIANDYPNCSGFVVPSNFTQLFNNARQLFPERLELVCLIDNSFLSTKGANQLKQEWETFSDRYPYYNLTFINTQEVSVNKIIKSICYEENASNKIVIVPKWTPFMAFLGKTSKAPFLSCEYQSLTNGAFGVYDVAPTIIAKQTGQLAAKILKDKDGSTISRKEIVEPSLFFDYKQLKYFNVEQNKVPSKNIINKPYWEEYKKYIIILNIFLFAIFLVIIIFQVRAKKREVFKNKNAQKRLQKQRYLINQRDDFDNIFHSIRDAVVTFDADLKIHFMNKSFFDILHISFEHTSYHFNGMSVNAFFHIYNNGKEILQDSLLQVLKSGQGITLPSDSFIKEVRNDNFFPISGEIIPLRAYGKVIGVVFSFRNVSEEEMQKHFFNLAVKDSSIYLWQFNIKTNCFTFPDGFLQKFGFQKGIQIISRIELENVIHPEDFSTEKDILVSVLLGKTKRSILSFRMLNSDNLYEWWEFRTSIIQGLNIDEPYSVLGICQSIQRHKQTEKELIMAHEKALETEKLKSAFLANMSHEIRTPLNSIIGFSDLLQNAHLFPKSELIQFVDIINHNCKLLMSLINDILDLSKIESGSMDFKLEDTNLNLIFSNIYNSFVLNVPQNVKLILDIPSDGYHNFVTDGVRLQQVVNNLLNNASKFTQDGTITFGYRKENDILNIFVIDTGIGMKEEDQKHIFDRFYKANNFTQGVGLGLSICNTIITYLKGEICVKSEYNVGTRFDIYLPYINLENN